MLASVPTGGTEQTRSDASRAFWSQVLVLCLAVAACYANSLRGPFLLDDPRPGVPLDYGRRALVSASFDLNRALTGEETWSFHVFNALVHLVCGLLLLGILRRTMARAVPDLDVGTRDGLAFVTTLLWLCHPLQTATVTYLSQRAEAMGACFYLAVVYAFLRSTSAARPWTWQTLALVALALGFATKETIATAPLVLWLFDALFLAGGMRNALRIRRGFYALAALVTLGLAVRLIVPLLRVDSAGFELQQFGALEYARTQPGVLLHYLRLALWPHPLCFDYGWPIAREVRDYLPQTLAVATLLLASTLFYLRGSWIGFAGAFFFLFLAPTSSFVPILDPAFEHRVYLPLVVPLLLVVAGGRWALARFSSPLARRLAPALACAAALALAALTIRRNQDYRSAVRMMQLTVECAPHHARARINLGEALMNEGRTEEAAAALSEALRIDPRDGFAYLNLGKAYVALEQVGRAVPLLQRAVEFVEDPRFREALGHALFLQGDHAASAPQFEKALEQDPTNPFLHCRLAHALAQLERREEALAHFREALRLEPELQEAHLRLATLLLELGQPGEALQHSLRALEIAPNTAGELTALGRTFRANGRLDDAALAYREAVRLDPGEPEPYAAYAETVCMSPSATLAERREALRLARIANEITSSTRPEYLAILDRAEAALEQLEDGLEKKAGR